MAERRANVSVSESGGLVAAYRTEWAADVVSADGRTVRIRPIRAHDSEKVLQLYERLSPESMYLRFFSPVPAEMARRTERLTQVDQDEHVVIVAELGDDLVAMARYDRLRRRHGRSCVRRRRRPPESRPGDASPRAPRRDRTRPGASADSSPRPCPRTRGCWPCSATRDTRSRASSSRARSKCPSRSARLTRRSPRNRRASTTPRRESIAGLLTPSSIAVIGASRRPRTIGHEVLRNLLRGGFNGPAYPVNPNARAVAGVRAYPTDHRHSGRGRPRGRDRPGGGGA